MIKKRGRPKLGPLSKLQRQTFHDAVRKPRGRPSFIPKKLVSHVLDLVALYMMQGKIKSRKVSVKNAVERVVEDLLSVKQVVPYHVKMAL